MRGSRHITSYDDAHSPGSEVGTAAGHREWHALGAPKSFGRPTDGGEGFRNPGVGRGGKRSDRYLRLIRRRVARFGKKRIALSIAGDA